MSDLLYIALGTVPQFTLCIVGPYLFNRRLLRDHDPKFRAPRAELPVAKVARR